MKYLPTIVLLVLTATTAAAHPSTDCDDAVDRQLFAAKTWMALGEWYHEHPHCVDGYMAERVTSQIAEWLAQERPTYLKLQAAIAAHPEFELLVNWELGGEYHSIETLHTIAENADKRCPAEASSLCATIHATVQQTLREAKKRHGRA